MQHLRLFLLVLVSCSFGAEAQSASFACEYVKKEIKEGLSYYNKDVTSEFLKCIKTNRVCVSVEGKITGAELAKELSNENEASTYVTLQSPVTDPEPLCLIGYYSGGSAAAWGFDAYKIVDGKALQFGEMYKATFNFDAVPPRSAAEITYEMFKKHGVDPVCAALAKPKELNKRTGMLALFCKYNEKHKATLDPIKHTETWESGDAKGMYSARFFSTYLENGKKKGVIVVGHQLLEGGEIMESYGTGEALSVFVFTFDGENWVFEQGSQGLLMLGAHGGYGGGIDLVKIGQNKHSVLFSSGYHHQGGWGGTYLFVALSEDKPYVIGSIVSDGGYDGSSPYKFESIWDLYEDKGKKYYVIKMEYKGTNYDTKQGKVIDYNKTEFYSIDNNKYKLIDDGNYLQTRALKKIARPSGNKNTK